ncbi:hypothetical protein DK847_09110 [Aestuariivirga litoralis]|uniref:Uncharacterized protein n=1 Tax=Aestuariivirga litoralis TaxID=2650924 RepID=A0A2W2APY6_9HYPH|nr:hypothetical protein [Aestuariivirga litoralis]PZF77465.1 hypothetical protein DK847_09110 [Aestuariivirga litoralis]
MTDGNSKSLATQNSSKELADPEAINLGRSDMLDLSGLTDQQKAELKKQYASSMISMKTKAEELKMDVGALDAAIGSFTDQASKAAQSGISATISHSQTSTIGRTEVIVGNTEKAAAGKLTRSALGEQDRTIWIVAIIAVAVIVVALLIVNR